MDRTTPNRTMLSYVGHEVALLSHVVGTGFKEPIIFLFYRPFRFLFRLAFVVFILQNWLEGEVLNKLKVMYQTCICFTNSHKIYHKKFWKDSTTVWGGFIIGTLQLLLSLAGLG